MISYMLLMRLLIPGGCGFIGSNFVRFVLEHYQPEFVTNVDVLTYAGNPENLAGVAEEHAGHYEFFQTTIAARQAMEVILSRHKFYAIVNFAAESHVDRSITDPANFIHTNVIGTEVQVWGQAIRAGLDGRSLRLARSDREVHGNVAA